MTEFKKLAQQLRHIAKELDEDSNELKKYRGLLRKVKDKESFGKLEFLIDNYKLRKKDPILAKELDEVSGKSIDPEEFFKKLRFLFNTKANLPAVKFLKKILDYGLSEGHQQLLRSLKNKRMKMLFGRGGE